MDLMPATLTELFSDSALANAHRPAVLHDGETTYGELAATVDLLAGRLQELGLAGERIGLLLPNSATFPLAFYAAQRAGCSTLLLNTANSRREVTEQLAAGAVSTVLTSEELAPLLPHGTRALLATRLPQWLGISDGAEPRDIELAGAPSVQSTRRGIEDEACLIFTAADGGWARGAVLSHRNLLANLLATTEAMAIGKNDVVMGVLPYAHAFGLTVTLNAPLAVGAAILPVERFRPQRILAELERRPATVIAGVPAIYLGIVAAAGRGPVPGHSLRLAISGGAPLPIDLALRWEEMFGIPLRQGYGLTEAAPVCLFNSIDRQNRPGTLGYPVPGVEASVRDSSGAELPAGEVGELCVRGPNLFGGYLDEGGRLPGEFWGDWFRTGDLASRSEDDLFRFHGMLKPMYTRNGFNVYPREVERVLSSEPDIDSAEVLALPDSQRENEIVVLVRLVPGSTLEEEDIRAICRERLATYKQPLRVEIEH
jgi:long-chain acyl-CoA synthetase